MGLVAKEAGQVPSNIITDIQYKDCGLKKFQNNVAEQINDLMDELIVDKGRIVVLEYLPRSGKTYSVLDYINQKNNLLSLYVSDVHSQIGQLKENFDKLHIIKGAKQMCPMKEQKQQLFHENIQTNLACKLCYSNKNCVYQEQFNYPQKDVILGIAKESLLNSRLHDSFDFIIFDENMTKSQKIKPHFPIIDKEILESLNYGSTILFAYENIEILKDDKTYVMEEDTLKMFREDAALLSRNNVIRATIDDIKSMDNPEGLFSKIVPFMANIHITKEWVERCYQVKENRPVHYKPYLLTAMELVEKYESNLIIANATYDENVYSNIKNQYKGELPDISKKLNLTLQNNESYLFHYNYKGRNCSKTALKKYDYYVDIIHMLKSIHRFCEKRGLKSGLITYMDYEKKLPEFDVKDHFIGHRGKNDFDDVDVLTILGTFNIPRIELLRSHYAISGEYLDPINLKEWNVKRINGIQINIPKNENFANTRSYLLYDEHLQAILRSGAHLTPKKVVIVFGYVPPSVENILKYRYFSNQKRLINGFLTHIFKQ